MQEWFWKTREQAELKEITVELQTQDGSTKRSWTFADAFPVRWSGPAHRRRQPRPGHRIPRRSPTPG